MKPQRREQEAFFISWVEESVRRIYELTREGNHCSGGEAIATSASTISTSRDVTSGIVRSGDKFTMFDMNSRFGTFLRGEQITEHVLEPGDSIELGRDRVPILFTKDRLRLSRRQHVFAEFLHRQVKAQGQRGSIGS
jgi:hypothetical protein